MSDIALETLCQSLAQIAPLNLAESWDNVGLLVGDRNQPIRNVITCLSVTPDVVREAIAEKADLIVTHHPLPFRPIQRITCDSIAGKLLWQLIGAQIGIYSAHTAFDSAAEGINQTWAQSIGLTEVQPIVAPTTENELGSGRIGLLPEPTPAREVVQRCGELASMIDQPRGVGPLDQTVQKVGFACGSGGSFLSAAHRCGCELLITGEATFHTCMEAESLGIALGLLGHYHSERFAMDRLAQRLQSEYPELQIWASRDENDPIKALPLDYPER